MSLVLEEGAALREQLGEALHSEGIDWRPFFVPMHQLPHLSKCRAVGRQTDECPETERLAAGGLNLPSSCMLDEATVRRIGKVVSRLIDPASAVGAQVGMPGISVG
jgi:perosamine synthetase